MFNLLRASLAGSVVAGSILLPGLAFSQSLPGGMNFEDLQSQALKAEQCMASISEQDVQKVERQGKTFEAKINELCKAGSRDEATAQAMRFANELREDPTINKIRKCSEGLTGMMAQMMPKLQSPEDFERSDGRHICD